MGSGFSLLVMGVGCLSVLNVTNVMTSDKPAHIDIASYAAHRTCSRILPKNVIVVVVEVWLDEGIGGNEEFVSTQS